MTTEMDPADVRRMVAERIAFLKKATDFAMMITEHRGVRSHYDPTARTRGTGTYDLQSFGGFRFHVELGSPVRVQIWEIREQSLEVLHVSWGEGKDVTQCCVHKLEPPPWPTVLLSVIDHWSTIADKIDAEQSEVSKDREARRQEERELQELYETARRLKVI